MAVEDDSSFSSILSNDQAALALKELVVGKKGDPLPGELGGWKTDGAPTSSVHLDLLLPVFKHHLAPCLSRKSVHCAYALAADCLVSIWQLRGPACPLETGKVANFKARSRSEVIDCSNLFYIESDTLKLAILENFGHGKDTECLGKGMGSLSVGFIKLSIYRTRIPISLFYLVLLLLPITFLAK